MVYSVQNRRKRLYYKFYNTFDAIGGKASEQCEDVLLLYSFYYHYCLILCLCYHQVYL